MSSIQTPSARAEPRISLNTHLEKLAPVDELIGTICEERTDLKRETSRFADKVKVENSFLRFPSHISTNGGDRCSHGGFKLYYRHFWTTSRRSGLRCETIKILTVILQRWHQGPPRFITGDLIRHLNKPEPNAPKKHHIPGGIRSETCSGKLKKSSSGALPSTKNLTDFSDLK